MMGWSVLWRRLCDNSTLRLALWNIAIIQNCAIRLRKMTAVALNHVMFLRVPCAGSDQGGIGMYWMRLDRIQKTVQTPQALAGFVVIFLSVLLNAFWVELAIGGFGLVIAAAMGVIGFALFYRGWTVDDR
jgi:hypothetical protein